MTKITLSDYSLIYNALEKKKMKIRVRMLRILKDELCLFALTNEPTNKLKVASIDDERISDDDFVISIGTIETLSINGLKGISPDQWYRNIVMGDLKYDVKDLLAYAPTLAKQVSGKLPVNSLYKAQNDKIAGVDKLLVNCFEDIISNTIRRERLRHHQISIDDILINIPDLDRQMICIAYLTEDKIDLLTLENYLKNLFNNDYDILKHSAANVRTNLRRLIRIYDYLKGKNKKKTLIKASFPRTPLGALL